MSAEDLTEVFVLPGVPGSHQRLSDGTHVYPSTTNDVMKLFREQGVAIEFQKTSNPRSELVLQADDVFLPVLIWGANALSGGVGGLFTHVIVQLLGRRQAETSVLHVKCGRRNADGTVKWFEAHGPGVEVIEALREFDSE